MRTARTILIRDITFAPYHMNTIFGAPNGDFCHGGPGITFIPGYNAGCQVLAEAGR